MPEIRWWRHTNTVPYLVEQTQCNCSRGTKARGDGDKDNTKAVSPFIQLWAGPRGQEPRENCGECGHFPSYTANSKSRAAEKKNSRCTRKGSDKRGLAPVQELTSLCKSFNGKFWTSRSIPTGSGGIDTLQVRQVLRNLFKVLLVEQMKRPGLVQNFHFHKAVLGRLAPINLHFSTEFQSHYSTQLASLLNKYVRFLLRMEIQAETRCALLSPRIEEQISEYL